ncbi:MAG TPA: cytochrome C oxidase subunit IV family protein [Phycisphaerae bacterium]|nr:cytochrome C oxidase subunit IV family protein [Phycisphaerae bacterium]HOM52955.1 cytochrome C oxidase subunit IV family protein [Phycisphaerae bacterium]HON67939.1 cytochrome C oxidase subunit IV family protein [Phycisphaerae bacterium]HOQ86301.1 cytochrome C oxidase subunit IV family protein [Phycisphaerae bacterium]HPP27196.1 cytochrome C oxidase subunit IV family protein [Phycisphaerae bacterium]
MNHAAIQPRTYLVVYIVLLVLLVFTIAGAYIPIHVLATVVAFVIATIKAILIVLYFMHVKESSTLVRVFGGAGLLWLGILIAGTLHDYLARGWPPPP